MGTWGVALYSDDEARDVRDTFRDLIGDGVESSAATEQLIRQWGKLVDDPDSGPPFWLALADTQWRLGRLVDRVRERALAIIDGGRDLERWRDSPKDEKKRAAVLARLKEQLLSPQPPPKRVPKRFRSETDWEVGEVVAYRMLSGREAIFRVIGHHQDRGGRAPVFEILKWDGAPGALPSRRDAEAAPVFRGARYGQSSQVVLGATSAREVRTDRITRLGFRSRPSQKVGGYAVFPWRFLDRQLAEEGLE